MATDRAPLTLVLSSDDAANAELVRILGHIPRDGDAYGPWWGTPEGLALLNTIKTRLGNPITRVVLNLYGVNYDSDDVAHTAIEILAMTNTAEAVRFARNPWGYLYRILRRELFHQVGPFFRSDASDLIAPDPATKYDGDYTDMESAIQLTVRALLPFTPPAARDGLEDVVAYLANTAGHRLSRACTEVTQSPELAHCGYDSSQLRAITNVVVGSRPKYAETSLLAGFVNDRDWNPLASPTHVGALRRYQARMHRNEAMAGLTAIAS